MAETNNEKTDSNRGKLELSQPRLLKYLIDRKSVFTNDILIIAYQVETWLERIPNVFPNYTLHNIDHSIRIMEYMYDLMEKVEDHSELEITILIYSALLHDIGMVVFDGEYDLIREGKYDNQDYCFAAMLNFYKDEKITIQNYVRNMHAQRSKEYVEINLANQLLIPTHSAIKFYDEVALLCLSHAKDLRWLKQNLRVYGEKGSFSYNMLYCAFLLRLADIMDIDSQRTPPFLYEKLILDKISEDEWKQHFVIDNLDKIKLDIETNQKYIALYGKCSSTEIHRKILSYIDWINYEVQNAVLTTQEMDRKYQINLKSKVKNEIKTEGFSFSDIKLDINFKAITELLMGERIYGERSLGLREVIQNAIDACKLRKEIEDLNRSFGDDDYTPIIKIILDEDNNLVSIKDNGTGMSMKILEKFFLNVGKSYYKSNEFFFKNFKYKPIGNFGIGFLATFMLSSDVKVKTKYFTEFTRYDIGLKKGSEYISLEEKKDPIFQGTEVILKYDEFLSSMGNDISQVRKFLERYFITDEISLELVDKKKREIVKINNKLCSDKNLKKKISIINLSDYLVDINGYVEIEFNKSELFKKSLKGIVSNDNNYYYDGKTLTRIDIENFDVRNLYSHGGINYFDIPLIDDNLEKNYQSAYDLYQDEESALSSVEDYAYWITVFVSNTTEETFPRNEDVIVSKGYKFGKNLSFDDLVLLGQNEKIPTRCFREKYLMYYDSINKLALPFKKEEPFSLQEKRLVYLRNVLVRRSQIKLISFLSCIKVLDAQVNVLNSNITTDISRNILDNDSNNLLMDAINKAINFWVLDKIPLKDSERKLLEEYIRLSFMEENPLLRDKKLG